MTFAFEGKFDRVSLASLKELVHTAVRNHSGWPPFLTLTRRPYLPAIADGALECWIGPDLDGSFDKPQYHDFWRIAPEGFLFTRRGYQEDSGFKDMVPGKFFDITSPTWRLDEAVLQASYIAQSVKAADANLICHASWSGLAGRRLVSHGNPNRIIRNEYFAAQDAYEATETIALSALPDALPEFVLKILSPMYELFDFFVLPKRLVEEELFFLRKYAD